MKLGAKILLIIAGLSFLFVSPSLAKEESAGVEGSRSAKTPQPTSASKVETQLVTSVDNSTVEEHTSLPSVTSAEIISSLVPEQSIVESLQKDIDKPSVINNEDVQLKTITVEAQLDSSFEEVTEEAPLAKVIEPSGHHANVSITEQQLKTDTLAEKRHKKTNSCFSTFSGRGAKSAADAWPRNAPMNETQVKAGVTLPPGVGAATRLLHLGSMYLLVAFWLLWVVPANNFDTNRLIKHGPSIDHLAVPMIPAQLVDQQNLSSGAGEEAATNATQQQKTDSKSPPDKESAQPAADVPATKEKQPAAPAVAAEEPKPATNQSEEIPSFNEWAQKQLAEAEKKKVQNASELPKAAPKAQGNIKIRSKNYASPDCGAKIVGANPEAQHASAVLSSSQDEYALSPCNSAKIWFVVELCEAIQAKQIELANYELFSSSPQEFSVFLSDRYPTRDWHSVGQFTAQDERTVQSFNLEPFLSFGKFIKIEMHSHYGKEHYCPVSMFRAYGTSEFEVLEEESHNVRPVDDDDVYEDVSGAIQPEKVQAKNLFGSATEAVISIVKKAAQAANVFAKTDSSNSTSSSDDLLLGNSTICSMSPVRPFSEMCPNCTPTVLNLLTCNYEALRAMLSTNYVLSALHRDKLCLRKSYNDSYLGVMLSTDYIAALCRILLPDQPMSSLDGFFENEIDGDLVTVLQPSEHAPKISSVTGSILTPLEVASSQSAAAPQISIPIQPTQTLKNKKVSEEVHTDALVVPTANFQPAVEPVEPAAPEIITEESSGEEETEPSLNEEWATAEHAEVNELLTEEEPYLESPNQPASTTSTTTVTNIAPPPSTGTAAATTATPTTVHAPQQGGQQKESVFVRLANRIKALERNMSLSAQYLEELSKRYKKQVDDMQKAFDRTLAIVTESSRQAVQREQIQAEKLSSLEQRFNILAEAASVLLAERESWQYKFTVFCHNIVLVSAVIYFILHLIKQRGIRTAKEVTPDPDRRLSIYKRHLSADDIPFDEPIRKRRNSELEPEAILPPPIKVSERQVLCVPSPKHDRLADKENKLDKMDPYKKKRKRLRKELRGMSVQDLCTGLSPGTLAMIRAPSLKVNPKPAMSPLRKAVTPKCRRHSTDNSIMDSTFWRKEFKLSDSHPEKLAVFSSSGEKDASNLTVELIQAEEEEIVDENTPPVVVQTVQPKKSTSGLKKMVKKLF